MSERRTATRDRLRRAVRNRCEPCHLCGGPIDYTLPHLDPGAFVIDHVVPLAKGGPDTLSNVAAAHRACNRAKGDKLMGELTATPREPVDVAASPIW